MLSKTAAFLEWCASGGINNSAKESHLFRDAMAEVERLRSLPERVLLAGSSRFKQAFENEAERLALEGMIVLGKHVFKPGSEWPLDEHHKDLIHAVQFRTCDLANRVHVINVDGYIGEDTYNLIRYAIRTETPITFMERYVMLMSSGAKVTAERFLQGTRQNVEFESAALGE